MVRTYHQPTQWLYIFIMLLSGAACWKLFIMWQTGPWYLLGFAIIPLVLFIACARPVIENRSISVGDGSIIIHQRFCQPQKFKLAKDLYQIVMKDEAVRSFRFQTGHNKSIQISPAPYQTGHELSEAILERIKQEGIVVEMVPA